MRIKNLTTKGYLDNCAIVKRLLKNGKITHIADYLTPGFATVRETSESEKHNYPQS
jgi:hypothetical protein